MSTFEPSGDDVRAYAETVAPSLEAEGAPAPEPQEEEPTLEEGVEAPEPQAAEDQPSEDLFDVTVDGETKQVTRDELQQGYMRGDAFTQKSQRLAAEREAFNAERAAHIAPRSPGLGVASGAYDPWGFPAAAPTVAQAPYASAEQAAAGVSGGEPAVRSAPAYPAADDDVVTRADLAVQQQIAAENRQMAAENHQILQRMHREQAERQAMDSLRARHQDFNEQACMERYYRLPDADQARLRAMPVSVRFELLHLGMPKNPVPPAQAKREAKPPKVPYSEPSRNVPDAGTRSAAATKEAPPTSDRQALGEWWLQNLEAGPARR